MRYYYDYSFPIGNLTIEEDGHGICGIYFGTKMLEGEKKNTELIREAALQLSQYETFLSWNRISDQSMESIGEDSIWGNLYLQRHCGISRDSKRMSSCWHGE